MLRYPDKSDTLKRPGVLPILPGRLTEGVNSVVKIKISYNTDQELERVVRLLSPALRSCRISRNKEGRYKKAYVELVENRA